MAVLKVASDANTTIGGTTSLPGSPKVFSGTVQKFFSQVITQTLLPVEEVVHLHRLLAAYVREAAPLFLIRAVSGTDRRSDYQTHEGLTFRATDNAPSWWMYGSLFAGHRIDDGYTRAVIESLPCHLFDVASRSAPVPSKAGWHIAHILPVKDRNTDYRSWTRRDLERRFVRNVHPANYFLLPSANWQRLGNDAAIVNFAAALHRERYAEIWEEFAELAEFDASAKVALFPDSRVEFGEGQKLKGTTLPPQGKVGTSNFPATQSDGVTTYRATRLLFRRDIIETLGEHERFRVVTPVGDFEMSKAEFYLAFPGVVASKSYREGGLYHFPSPPKRADAFRRPQP